MSGNARAAAILMTLVMLPVVPASAGKGKAATGTLSVTTTPWTEVTVDGKQVGNTPVVGLVLEAGKHTVELSNDGMELSLTVSIKVKKGKHTKIAHTFEVTAGKGQGSLSVVTSPWTEVLLDGEPIGTTPLEGHAVDPGTYVLELRNEGLGISETLTVKIASGSETRISKTLTTKAKSGTLSVSTHPWSEVHVNGVDLGATPIIKHKLEPGKHVVKLVNETLGFEESLTVKIRAGEDTKVVKDLTTQTTQKTSTGTLSVITTPWTAVYVDGKKVGNTPVIKKKLEPGKHEVKLTNEDLDVSESLTVVIVAGEHTKIVRDLE